MHILGQIERDGLSSTGAEGTATIHSHHSQPPLDSLEVQPLGRARVLLVHNVVARLFELGLRAASDGLDGS